MDSREYEQINVWTNENTVERQITDRKWCVDKEKSGWKQNRNSWERK